MLGSASGFLMTDLSIFVAVRHNTLDEGGLDFATRVSTQVSCNARQLDNAVKMRELQFIAEHFKALV